MGKGRRNTAKTGDKGIYKKRDALEDDPKKPKDGDPMYDEVDQFHNQQDFLKLDRDDAEESEDDEIDRQEAVMDLGAAAGDSSDDDDDDSSSDDEDLGDRRQKKAESTSDEEEQIVSMSSDEDDEMQPMKTVRDWGRQKKDYYDGDTADLEIGQEEDDALVEEEAAKELQSARLSEMKEEDFVMSDDEEEDESKANKPTLDATASGQNWTKLSRQEKMKLLDRKHPELLPLVSHFSGVLSDWKDKTDVVSRALLEGEKGTVQAVGATKSGQQYLLSKALLQASAGLNLAAYLLLKSEHAEIEEDADPAWIQSHPVMKHLHIINALSNKLTEKVEEKVPGLGDQMDKLVKASALLSSGEVDLESGGQEADEESSIDEKGEVPTMGKEENAGGHKELSGAASVSDNDSEESGDSDGDNAVDEHAEARNLANEVRFGLRASEVATTREIRQRRQAPASDFGDEGAADAEVSKSLAATLNSIEQRSATRKRKTVPMADTIDYTNEEDRMRRALDAIEADLGPPSDEDAVIEGDEDAFDPEVEDEGGAFYASVAKKSKSRKDFKKTLYSVKPKYPRMEEEIDGERPISKAVMKNRGLVAHKNKLNRNPRVKKREQFRKANIRRRGAVREVRTNEGHKYGGEAAGIKSNVSHSRRLAG